MRSTVRPVGAMIAAPLLAARAPEHQPPADSATLHRLPPRAVYAALGSRPGGLSSQEAADRLAADGPNTLQGGHERHLLRRFLANFTHLMALLLWAGALLALVAGLPELAVAICTVNVINGVFSFWQEYRAERATEALAALLPAYAQVLRDGREERLLVDDLVRGDVLLLAEGDRISADGRLVEDHELRVDQSTLTGESHPVRRAADACADGDRPAPEHPNLVFAGTSVASGRGKAVVSATGMRTEFGRIADLTAGMRRETSPLQVELTRLSRIVGIIAVACGIAFFLLAELLTPMGLSRGLVFALGMIVAFVPEGLLPTVTLALAMGTQRMARRHALVKRLSSVEALGCTSVICTDKTGTLTQNEMTVRDLYLGGARYAVDGAGYTPEGSVRPVDGGAAATPGDLADLLRAGALANDARLLPPDDGHPRWRIVGDPTEAAMQVVAAKGGLDLAAERAAHPRVRELPFESVRKRMSTVHTTAGGRVLYAKGAPRELLACCTWMRVGGRDVPLDEAGRGAVLAMNDAYSRRALRVLAVAMRQLPDQPAPGSEQAEDLERDLTFLGLVAMMDPPRPEVAAAIVTCRRAGIRILMMTGDYGLTAESIGRRIGLVDGDVRIVNGDELDHTDEAGLTDLLAGESVIFARTTPAHKLRVVTALQSLGHVVAVTGDGVNDAPALKKADIGVAMGMAGTDVAREAADMILLDDNFASIVAAVEEGRGVYANIRRFTGYIFTSNTPEAVPFVLFGFSGGRIPIALGVMHILAIDLGTDLVPALALGAERPEPGVMDLPPRGRDEHLITRALLLRSYGWLGPAQAAAAMLAFYVGYWHAGLSGWLDLPSAGPRYATATAMALAAVVTTQIGNLFAHRTERRSIRSVGWFSNRLAWIGIASELAVIALIVYVPALNRVIGTGPIPPVLWLFLFALAPLLLVIDEARKAWLRRRAAGR